VCAPSPSGKTTRDRIRTGRAFWVFVTACERSLNSFISFTWKFPIPTTSRGTLFVLLAVSSVAVGGCKRRETVTTATPAKLSTPGHQHGPHGGHVIDLGTIDNSAELVFSPADPIVGVYMLGADASKDAAIDAKSISLHASVDGKLSEYELHAVRQSDDAPNKCSYFELQNEQLYEIATGNSSSPGDTRLRLSLKIDGLPFAGEVDTLAAQSHVIVAPVIPSGKSDAPIWEKKLTEAGYNFLLGHQGVLLLAGADVEPAVQISLGDKPIEGAQVFSALLAEDGKTVLAAEVPAVFKSATGDTPAHYAQGKLKIPAGTRAAILRFRVILPENKGEHTFNLPVAVR
jgi:hypothetical protein